MELSLENAKVTGIEQPLTITMVFDLLEINPNASMGKAYYRITLPGDPGLVLDTNTYEIPLAALKSWSALEAEVLQIATAILSGMS